MLTIRQDPTLVLETGSYVYTVAFHLDGKHVLGGNKGGIRVIQRRRLSDHGEDVGKQTGLAIMAISVSRDHKWIVCGTKEGARVWDGEMEEKVIVVESEKLGGCSTRYTKEASIWSITSGQRLVGPLHHDNYVIGIRFSPSGDRIATACYGSSVQIFDSHTGDKLVTIDTNISEYGAITPLAWSSDGQQVFAASRDNKIRAFDASTGIKLAESQILRDGKNDVYSIALAANGKFIATFASLCHLVPGHINTGLH
ncbi:WD40-repeat-containing domain protein [Butyriboletus roseoflavus]|nr:WD40-repeat-containing domain protein [Butyriboletus roseoflavus]